MAGYSLLDNAYSKANPGTTGLNLKGKAPVGVPSQQASAWARYQLQGGPLAGLGVGGGVRYIGSSYGDEANTCLLYTSHRRGRPGCQARGGRHRFVGARAARPAVR